MQPRLLIVDNLLSLISNPNALSIPTMVGDNKLTVAYWRNTMNKEIHLQIPEKADRCVVLIAHPATKGDMTEVDRAATTKIKDGNTELIAALSVRFGRPQISAGQSNASIMAAVSTCAYSGIATDKSLDTPNSKRRARKCARRILFQSSINKTLVVAYGDRGIVNKAMGSKNVSKTGAKPLTDATVIYISRHNRVVGVHKQDLLELAA